MHGLPIDAGRGFELSASTKSASDSLLLGAGIRVLTESTSVSFVLVIRVVPTT